ncbi:guanylin-like [Colossoma macropomum]|uniref:guanylin-like n=1 Tax=Colossoma macropomum TaxID=42526 RepID=UPI001863CBC1|nr:guanylin-like [Colossoma macropomum]
MKMLLPTILLILVFSLNSEAVTVREGEFSFSLESVKKLWAIMAEDIPANQYNRLAINKVMAVCKNPVIPKEFEPLCQSKHARASFSRLALLARRSGVCEICAYAACTGC